MTKILEPLTLPQKLRSFRRTFGLSQEEAAHLLGTTATTLSRWMTRRTAEPDPVYRERMERLSAVAEQAGKVIRPGGVARWFKTPNPLLIDLRPLDLMGSAAGLQKVQNLLASMEWGLPV